MRSYCSMASASLLHSRFWLPKHSPPSAKPCISLSSLLSCSAAPSLTHGSAANCRSKGTAVVFAGAAWQEEGEAAVVIDTDGGEEEEVSEVVGSEEKLPGKPWVKLGDIMGVKFLNFGDCSFGSLLLLSSCNAISFSLIWLILNKRAIEASVLERPVLYIRNGDVVEIKLSVDEI